MEKRLLNNDHTVSGPTVPYGHQSHEKAPWHHSNLLHYGGREPQSDAGQPDVLKIKLILDVDLYHTLLTQENKYWDRQKNCYLNTRVASNRDGLTGSPQVWWILLLLLLTTSAYFASSIHATWSIDFSQPLYNHWHWTEWQTICRFLTCLRNGDELLNSPPWRMFEFQSFLVFSRGLLWKMLYALIIRWRDIFWHEFST